MNEARAYSTAHASAIASLSLSLSLGRRTHDVSRTLGVPAVSLKKARRRARSAWTSPSPRIHSTVHSRRSRSRARDGTARFRRDRYSRDSRPIPAMARTHACDPWDFRTPSSVPIGHDPAEIRLRERKTSVFWRRGAPAELEGLSLLALRSPRVATKKRDRARLLSLQRETRALTLGHFLSSRSRDT